MPKVSTRGQAWQLDFEDGSRTLMGTIEIDCPICGQGTYQIMGHHMRAIRDLLTEWIEKNPDLVDSGEGRTEARTEWRAQGSKDPTLN